MFDFFKKLFRFNDNSYYLKVVQIDGFEYKCQYDNKEDLIKFLNNIKFNKYIKSIKKISKKEYYKI